jgi:hypothetical protein
MEPRVVFLTNFAPPVAVDIGWFRLAGFSRGGFEVFKHHVHRDLSGIVFLIFYTRPFH